LEEFRGFIDCAIEVAENRAKLLQNLKDALEANDDQLALTYARQLCGVKEE